MQGAGTLRRNPLQRLRVRLLGLLPGCHKMSCGMPAAYSIFRKTCHAVADVPKLGVLVNLTGGAL
jgi:hypothetical protein